MNKKPTQTLILFLAAAGWAASHPVRADLTMTGRSSVSSIGMPVIGKETLQIHNKQLRRDLIDRGRAYSFLYDLGKREVAVMDHALRQATIYSMPSKANTPEARAVRKDLKLDLDKTGRKHALQDWTCEEHQLEASIPTEIGQDKAVFRLVGTVWLAAGTAEQKEMNALRKAAEAPDFLPGVPIQAKISEDQALVVAEVIRRLAGKGMLCALDVESQYEGTGRMVELARKVATRFGLTYDSYATDKLAEEAFQIPDGYRRVAAPQ